MRRFDAVIAGAGAAGMFCAVQLGWRGKSVAVIEHSGCQGRKLMITGKGRCNVTNNCTADTVMKNILTACFEFAAKLLNPLKLPVGISCDVNHDFPPSFKL